MHSGDMLQRVARVCETVQSQDQAWVADRYLCLAKRKFQQVSFEIENLRNNMLRRWFQ